MGWREKEAKEGNQARASPELTRRGPRSTVLFNSSLCFLQRRKLGPFVSTVRRFDESPPRRSLKLCIRPSPELKLTSLARLPLLCRLNSSKLIADIRTKVFSAILGLISTMDPNHCSQNILIQPPRRNLPPSLPPLPSQPSLPRQPHRSPSPPDLPPLSLPFPLPPDIVALL